MNKRLYFSIFILKILICSILFQEVANSSLIFVFDNTHSMSRDIKNVLKSADTLFDTVVNSKKSEINDTVIVTFNDPGVDFLIRTNNRDDFKKSLKNLRVYGGDDCPEMALSGIELGLKYGRPYSYVFVFTDARAKDVDKFETVKNLALKLNTKINFLVTETFCPNETQIDFSLFDKLAHDTGGEFFIMNKKNIPEIMKYVIKLMDSKKVEIKRQEFKAPDKKQVVVNVDHKTENVVMTVKGDKPTVEVKDKNSTKVDTEKITSIRNATVLTWNNTNPGDYTVDINCTTNTLVVVHGTTKVSFIYGFSVNKPNYLNETTNRPVADQKSYVVLKLNTEGDSMNLRRLQVVDLKDKILIDKLNFVADEDQYYITEPIEFPKETFKIVMTAEDDKTKDLINRASLPIEPQKAVTGVTKNKAPTVTILGEAKVATSKGNTLQLKCKITGYPKPKILWEDAFGKVLASTVSTVREEPYEFLSVLNIEKIERSTTYICKASNIINSDEKSVEVQTGDNFNVVKVSKDTAIEFNKEGKIFCKVNANPLANVTWLLNGDVIKENDDFAISSDTSTLTIKKMKPEYTGIVFCDIRSSNNIQTQRLPNRIKLSIILPEKVKIDKNITKTIAVEGSSVRLSCRVLKGSSNAIMKWSFKGTNNYTFWDIEVSDEEIRIERVSTNNVGTYKCVAKNDYSEDSHIIDLIMEYAPFVLNQSNIDINQEKGTSISIPCDIKGEPAPTVHWFFNGLMIVDSNSYQIDNYNTLTFEVSDKTVGQYTCEGVNKLGSIKKIANVLDTPRLISTGLITMTIDVGMPLNLVCPVKGYPTPKIQWVYRTFFGTNENSSIGDALFHIPEATINDNGIYTCSLPDFPDISGHVFFVTVNEPTESIEENIEAMDLDKFLRLPCKSVPDSESVTWFKNGEPIIIGNEWHNLDLDGSLIIKEVKPTTSGKYDCATNDRSKVFKTFTVSVAAYPKLTKASNVEYFLENENGTIECKAAQNATDHVRWYKNKKVVDYRKNITLEPYNDTIHKGKYICRVNNMFKSSNYAVQVQTGLIPKFEFTADSLVKHFRFDEGPFLTCANIATPKAQITWWKNDVKMHYNGSTYSVTKKINNIGTYKCLVKNQFGNISRQFIVTSNDCLLNIETDLDGYHPFILTQTQTIPNFYIKDGHVAIPINTTVLFYCKGSYNIYSEQFVNATCREGKTFEINGKLVDYNTLKCKEALQPTRLEDTPPPKCNGKLYEIGLSVIEFIEIYKICINEKRRFLYTEHIIQPWAAGLRAAALRPEKWFDSDMIIYDKNEAYDCKRQRYNITGREDECYIARQLINEKDLPPGYPQLLTHSYLNTVPHWNSNTTKYWNILEEIIRTHSKSRTETRQITVITGANYDVVEGQPLINITDKAGNLIKVPTFLWKVVINDMRAASVAIVQINLPPLLINDITKFRVCDSRCNEITWITEKIDKEYLDSGFMLCCSTSQFEINFGYVNLKQNRKRLLTTF